MSNAYLLAGRGYVLCHHRALVLWCGDHAEPRNPELDAVARSGDFFITLATKLENVAAELPETSIAASSLALSKLAQELEYMQRNYEVTRKPAADSGRAVT